MTKAEAIAMLKRIQEPEAWEPQINQAAFEALDMAIKALSQESSEDVISRQAAIAHAISGRTREFGGDKWIRVSEVRESLQTMPSAQSENIRCIDCIWWSDKNGGFCDIWDHYISNEEFFCGCGERREDVVEVVRCADCKHFHGDGLECRWGMYAYEDDFCSNGERRGADG